MKNYYQLKVNCCVYHLRYFNYKLSTVDLKMIKEHRSWCQRAYTKTISCNTIKIPFLRVSFLFLQQVEHLPEFQRKAIFLQRNMFSIFFTMQGFYSTNKILFDKCFITSADIISKNSLFWRKKRKTSERI